MRCAGRLAPRLSKRLTSEHFVLLRDVNRGPRDALGMIRTANRTLQPGVLSDLDNLDQVLSKIEDLYGRTSNTPEGKMQLLTDRSVAEAITLHNISPIEIEKIGTWMGIKDQH